MYAPLPSALIPRRAVFLNAHGGGGSVDAPVLRRVGVRSVLHLTSGRECLALLEKEAAEHPASRSGGVEAVICGENPEDMSLAEFLHALASHPVLAGTPVLVLAADPAGARPLREAGVPVLDRPYGAGALESALAKAMSPMRVPLVLEALKTLFAHKEPGGRESRAASPVRNARAREPKTTSDLYAEGVTRLKDQDYAQAERDFLDVLKRSEDHVEACLALARVYRARGETTAMRRFLLRAAAACLRKGDSDRAASIAALLPKHIRSGNLYAHEALARLENGEYKAAALGFLDACRDLGNIPLHSLLARYCQFTPAPEEALRKLCMAYDALGHSVTAKKLRDRLLHNPEYNYSPGPDWLDNYPVLKEAVSVVSYTTWAWRHA